MSLITSIINFVNNNIYAPNGLILNEIIEESHNSKYSACTFKVDAKTIRFRVAKITPTKMGQFVTFWEKDNHGVNQAYQYDQAPDLLVTPVFKSNCSKYDNKMNNSEVIPVGQFVFPKDILLEKNILKSNTTKGKMGIRVYPSWDIPTSTTAIKTQQWQLEYFFKVTDIDILPIEKIKTLYGQ